MMTDLNAVVADSPDLYEQSLQIRFDVFVDEQGVPRALEVDPYESESTHFLVLSAKEGVGCGRMRLKGSYSKFERIATRKTFRGQGVGRVLMRAMEAYAESHFPKQLPAMHAQLSAVGFYEKLGWIAVGDVFYEANLGHRFMICPPRDITRIKALNVWTDPHAKEDVLDYLKSIL